MLKIKQSSIIYLVINQLWQSFGIDWSGTNGYTHVIWHWGGGVNSPIRAIEWRIRGSHLVPTQFKVHNIV